MNKMRSIFPYLLLIGLLSLIVSCEPTKTPTEVPPTAVPTEESIQTRIKFQSGDAYLIVEFLDDDLVHFELSPTGPGPDTSEPLFATPMVLKGDYQGPTSLLQVTEDTYETSDLRVQVDQETLCITTTDIAQDADLVLSQFCPWHFDEEPKGLTLTPETFTHAYGLGQKFISPDSPDLDWVGQVRLPGEFGNVMEDFNSGKAGNTQFPIVYFAGESTDSYALFLDNQYEQEWDFRRNLWQVAMGGEQIRFYIMTGPDLQDLRSDFMELVGNPLVPPKKMFGLWVSEYGYDNWEELEDKLGTLRANSFPIDGFVLDLQWFGGVIEDSDDTQEGSLTWDEGNFPNPEDKIASLWGDEGIGLIAIEQSYVGKNLPEHEDLEEKGYLVSACETCGATYLEEIVWWGKGGMIDWTNDDASAYWHDWKREPLIEGGIIGHWTDLGEPEVFDADAWYSGIADDDEVLHSHADVHNLYNFLWSKSIYDGYVRNENTQRPFSLSRSGTAGIQRFGTAMWSGDISGLLSSLSSHFNAQMHMSMSGMDYFSADIGGFWRVGGNLDEMYTQWYAYGMLFDVPGRPHTFNVFNSTETAPDRLGDLESNLENTRLRYALSPYLYSLAHRAYLYSEPVYPPLVYYFQSDPNVREMGSEKLIGPDLLVAPVANPGEVERRVYLPEGKWVHFHSGEWIEGSGDWFGPFLEYPLGRFTLPLFARAGAIIPMMYVDEQTMNIMGKRLDGSRRDELIVRVYADGTSTSFTLYEDDGVSTAYQDGEVRTTEISQQMLGDVVAVTVAAAGGSFTGASDQRDNLIQLYVSRPLEPTAVNLNGTDLAQYGTAEELTDAESGWWFGDDGVVMAKSGEHDVSEEKEFTFILSETTGDSGISGALPISWPTDGWQQATPEEVGIDSEILASALDLIQEKNIYVHNVLITRNGYLTMDAPIYRITSGQPSDQLSVTRAVIASLIGVAIDQGFIEGVNQPVADFFQDREVQNLDGNKRSITIEHLLTMTSGLSCQDPTLALQLAESEDWVQFMIDLPVEKVPGEAFYECFFDSHLLSALLQEATGMTTLEYANQTLFEPLGITEVNWLSDPKGVNYGALGLQMSASDTAKLGLLFINGGLWDTQQLVPLDWLQISSSEHVSTDLGGFGYGWWIDPSGAYYAREKRGQWLMLHPDRDLVVVFTSGQRPRDATNMRILTRGFLIEAASPSPLPQNPEGVANLQAGLELVNVIPEPQPVPDLPPTAHSVSGKTYVMDEVSETGWEEIRFAFPGGDEASIYVLAEEIGTEFYFGMDGLYRIPPEELGVPDSAIAAGRGWWEGENIFMLDYDFIFGTDRNILKFTFEGNSVEVTVATPEGDFTVASGQFNP
jgi:alpha-glucosidase